MEARVLGIETDNPEVSVSANDSKSFRRYLSEGFYVLNRKDGFYRLKKGGILVTVEYNGKKRMVDFSKCLFAYYGKAKEYELIEKLKNDLGNDIITIEVDSKGHFSIIEKWTKQKEKEFL